MRSCLAIVPLSMVSFEVVMRLGSSE